MDFTREPIIETIITPKDGCKLVIRSSKAAGQEEYFVDAVEVVSFGHALFFRSLERPKAFLVPVSDYEVLEVRETRMVLKNIGVERSIKIGGGREGGFKTPREEKVEAEPAIESPVSAEAEPQLAEGRPEMKLDKKRERRRHYRKKKGGREEGAREEQGSQEFNVPALESGERIDIPVPEAGVEQAVESLSSSPVPANVLSSLLQPPPQLISETINRYRENELFKNVFFLPEEEYQPHGKADELLNEDEDSTVSGNLQNFEEPQSPEQAEPSEESKDPLASGEEPLTEESKQEQLSTWLVEEISHEEPLPFYVEEEEELPKKEGDEAEESSQKISKRDDFPF